MFSLKVSSILLLMMMMVMVSFVNSDTSKDRDECASQLVGLAVCLPYVGGTAKAPTPDCCSGLKGVIEKSKKCLCLLVKDRNDPALGLKINATLALSLPATCHVPSNASECPALLHLAPNSPEAQVFEEFAKNSKAAAAPASSGNTPSSSNTKSSTQEKSGASRGKRWFGTDTVIGILLWGLTSNFIFGCFENFSTCVIHF